MVEDMIWAPDHFTRAVYQPRPWTVCGVDMLWLSAHSRRGRLPDRLAAWQPFADLLFLGLTIHFCEIPSDISLLGQDRRSSTVDSIKKSRRSRGRDRVPARLWETSGQVDYAAWRNGL